MLESIHFKSIIINMLINAVERFDQDVLSEMTMELADAGVLEDVDGFISEIKVFISQLHKAHGLPDLVFSHVPDYDISEDIES